MLAAEIEGLLCVSSFWLYGDWFYRFGRFLCKLFYRLVFDFQAEGTENISRNGAFLIVANHVSFLDPVAIGISIKRPIFYMARDDLFHIPILGWVIRHFHVFPVKRGRPDRKALRRAMRILEDRGPFLIFPEGTRSPDGKLKRGLSGAGMLAYRSKAKVLPAFIMGTEKALPLKAKWIRPHKVRVRFGKPFFPSQLGKGKADRELYRRITDEIMEHIAELGRNGEWRLS